MNRVAVCGALLLGAACVTTTGAGEVKRALLTYDEAETRPGWVVMRTPQFELHTDLAPELAQRAGLLLMQSLGGLEALFSRAPTVGDDKLTIIAMADSGEFERRFTMRVGGFAVGTELGTTLVVYGPPDRWFERTEANYEGVSSVLQHELAHAVLRRYFRRQPRWFAEGLAQYLETARWVDAETLVLGDVNLDAYRKYLAVRSLTVADMVAWNKFEAAEKRELGLYGLSWAFVHYARNREPELLAKYMSLLRTSAAEAAWAQTFGGQGEALDKQIHAYMLRGQYQQLTAKLPMGTPTVTRLENGDASWVKGQLDGFEKHFKR